MPQQFRVHILRNISDNGDTTLNHGRLQKENLGQKHLGNNVTLFKGSRSGDINDEAEAGKWWSSTGQDGLGCTISY